MKQLLFIITLFFSVFQSNAQVETNYYAKDNPIRNHFKYFRKNTVVKTMPTFDLQKIRKEDAEMDGEDVPYRFGKGFDVSYTFEDGLWEDVEGGRLWTISFKSEGAISLNYIIENFYLPEGASFYIENQDETVLYGPVTSENLSKQHDSFLTDIIPGDQSTFYLIEPLEKRGESQLTIKRVIHGYRGILFDENYRTVNGSSSCNYDVACLPAYEKESNAIVLSLLSSGEEWCSGSLLMTTNYTFDPYFLTAFHCVDWPNPDSYLDDSEINAASNWMFKFCFKKTSCGGSILATDYTYNKADFCSAWYNTDFALMKLKGPVAQNNVLTWLGWDRTGNTPSSTTSIHHPAGDVMKISVDYDAATSISQNGGSNNFWQVDFDYGITEGGSSGAPLLNQQKRVVGQLFGGPHTTDICNWTQKTYGKFNLSWTGGGHDYDRLSNWLDPIGTNQMTINSCSPSDLFIDGATAPCGEEIYSIHNLPEGLSVEWCFSDPNSTYANLLYQNTPSQNECTLALTNNQRICETLIAKFMRSGTLLKTKNKLICNGPLTLGTYSQTGNGTFPNIGQTLFDSETGFTINPLCDVTISSIDFAGLQFTVTGVTPTYWSFDSLQTISVRFPFHFLPRTATIKGIHPQICSIIEFPVHIDPMISYLPMSVSQQNEEIIIVLNREPQKDSDNDFTSSCQIGITNSTNGQNVYYGEMNNNSLHIKTSGWKPGVYVVSCTVGDKNYTQKINIR